MRPPSLQKTCHWNTTWRFFRALAVNYRPQKSRPARSAKAGFFSEKPERRYLLTTCPRYTRLVPVDDAASAAGAASRATSSLRPRYVISL